MKVAAYQAPLLHCGSMEAIELIRQQVKRCESEGVAILCCPEPFLAVWQTTRHSRWTSSSRRE